MESLLIPAENTQSFGAQAAIAKAGPTASSDSLILASLTSEENSKNNDFRKVFESLSLTAQKVLEKLDVYLAEYVPGGVSSLKPENHTAEKTAERIVNQITGLYGAYAKQNPDKSAEELVSGFMSLARKGVEQGYGEAYEILENIGAFEVDGVQSGVEETKKLIEEKLTTFENYLRKELGIDTAVPQENDISAPVKNDLLAQGGATTIDVTA